MNQLRVRTEFSFGETFAPLDRVTAQLKAVGAQAAGCVDVNGTWGHVRWEAACREAGITPIFGAEIGVVKSLTETKQVPSAWFLARDVPALYRLTSLAHKQLVGGRPALTVDQYLSAEGVVKFTGAALLDHPEAVEAGCFIDVNPGSVLLTSRAVALAKKTKGRLVVTSDNYYASVDDRRVLELIDGNVKPTPQHLLTRAEAAHALPLLNPKQFGAAVELIDEIVGLCGEQHLKQAPIIKVKGDVEKLCRVGIKKRLAAGHIGAWNEVYEARLQRELALVKEKAFDSYFLVVADMVEWAKQRMLVGPARGSAAGSLVCYVMGITEVDPLPYGLMFERFVDITRKDLPDIDLDFPDSKRDLVYDYLADKYGRAQVARIGTISELKPKSALAQVAKSLRVPPWETQAVKDAMFVRSSGDSRANNCLSDTLKETEPGRQLLERYPAIENAGAVEGHASHSGVHAAGVIVCNVPIEDYCTVANGIAQLDKMDAEKLNLLKIDALGLRTLSVIEDSGMITSEQIYSMPLDDPAVFDTINSGRFTGIFQWEGQALQSLTSQIHIANFDDMAHITALARPGPLGGGAAGKFAGRRSGRDKVDVAHPSMLPYLSETYGLVLYQEQVMRIVREIGKFDWDDTSAIRKAMSGRKGKEFFDRLGEKFAAGAASIGLKEREAKDIWDQINSMGAWAFNKSHSVSYALISYWTAWLKAHHPLQYAAAALRNAKDEETAFSMLREIVNEGVEYVPFDPLKSELNWSVQDGKLIGGFLGLKGIGPSTAAEMLKARANGGLTEKHLAKLQKAERLFGELYPARAMWRDYYENPEAVGIRSGSKVLNIADFPESGPVLFIGQLKQKDSRDYNEAVRLAKRDGRRMKGPTVFLDMRVMDDTSLSPLLCRVDRYDYEPIGRLILERGKEGHSWFLIRGDKLKGFPMVSVTKVKCLDDPGMLNPDSPG